MKRTMLIVSLIFSLLFVNVNNYGFNKKNNSFNTLAKEIVSQYPFVENGIKIEYYTSTLKDQEIEKIYHNINRYFKADINEDEITAKEEQLQYTIDVFNIDEKTKVDVEIINSNKDRNIDYLVKKANLIIDDNNISSRVFKYLKVKNDIDCEFSNVAKENIKLDTNRSLLINNGTIYSAIMKDGDRLNIAKVNYNTGSYLIIGTPTIFVTY